MTTRKSSRSGTTLEAPAPGKRKAGATAAAAAPKSAAGKELPRAHRSFLVEYIKNPKTVGALMPSSKHLAARMIRASGIQHARTVVEYGPGTGAFSGLIEANLAKGAKYFAIELSDTMVGLFKERHPKLHIHCASVTDLPRLLRLEGLPPTNSVDLIFSGLPWASFPEKLQRQLLVATMRALRPGGIMLTFSYAGISAMTPGGKRLAKLLPHYFARVEKTDLVLRNIPPAFIYRCTKGLDPTSRQQ